MYAVTVVDFDILPTGDAESNIAEAMAIWAVLGILRLWWLGSWLLAYLRSWYWVRYFPIPISKYVMQTDLAFVAGHERYGPRPRVRGPRGCNQALSCAGKQLADRTYHSGTLDAMRQKGGKQEAHKLYDHYCTWINVLVHADTMKPYLIAILGMTIDSIVVIILSIFAMAHPAHREAILHVPAGMVGCLM